MAGGIHKIYFVRITAAPNISFVKHFTKRQISTAPTKVIHALYFNLAENILKKYLPINIAKVISARMRKLLINYPRTLS